MKTSYLHIALVIVGLTACASNRPDATDGQTVAAVDTAAASTPVEVVSAPVEPGSGDDALICEQVHVTGKLIPKRVCKTRAQMEKERLEGRALTESLQGHGPSFDPAGQGKVVGGGPR